jgi:hypothetical protein
VDDLAHDAGNLPRRGAARHFWRRGISLAYLDSALSPIDQIDHRRRRGLAIFARGI